MSHFLIIYDIRNEKRLNKVSKVLLDYGIRVQRSVFEIDAEEKQLSIIRLRLKKIIESDDYIVYFRICERDWQKRQKFGVGHHLSGEGEPYEIL